MQNAVKAFLFFLFLQSYSAGAELSQGSTPFLTVARDSNGYLKTMTFKDASAFCAKMGQRLPAVRELAAWTVLQGAKGIRETRLAGASYDSPALKLEERNNNGDGFTTIYKFNADGSTGVDFYVNSDGYRPPANDLRTAWFWSSSIYPDPDNFPDPIKNPPPKKFAYFLAVEQGYVYTVDDMSLWLSVGCVQD